MLMPKLKVSEFCENLPNPSQNYIDHIVQVGLAGCISMERRDLLR